MKRIALLLSVVLLLVLLASCGDSGKTTPPETTPPTTTPGSSEYDVTFSVNGVSTTVKVEAGELPVFSGSTADKVDGTKTYRFAGWDKEIVAASENVTYTAVYKRVMTIRWVHAFGDVTSTLLDGETPVAPTEATGDRMNDAETHVFTGWDKALSPITEAAYDAVNGEYTFTAQYITSPRTYTATFKNGDTVLGTESVPYGEKPVFSGIYPSVPAGYNYCGFTNTEKAVTGDVTCEAFFTVYDADQLLWALSREDMSFRPTPAEVEAGNAINDNRGAMMDEAGGLVFLMLEYRNAPADSTFKATAKAKIVKSMKFLMTSDAEQPMFSLEPYWSYNPLTSLVLLAKNTPDIWNELTAAEQEKYDFMMKAFAYIINLGFADGNGFRTGPGYRGNFHKSWNVNYRLALVPAMVNCAKYFGGADALDEILLAFDYDATIAKFTEYGWQRAINEWTKTPPTFTKDKDGNTVDAYTMPSQKEIMENGIPSTDPIYYDRYGDGIPDDAGYGKGVRFAFKYNGVRLDDVAGIFNQLLTENYSGGLVVSGRDCRPNADTDEWTKAYILDGTKSPYEGLDGMLVELSKENRSSCIYGSEDFILVTTSLAVWGEFGMYDITKDGLKDNLFYKTWIGNMDFLYKIEHGYQSFQTSSNPMSKPTYETADKGQLMWRSWWTDNFGHYTPETLPYKDPFDPDLFTNDFNVPDFDITGQTVPIGEDGFLMNNQGAQMSEVHYKTLTDPNNPANKMIAVEFNKIDASTTINVKQAGALTQMGENTKLTFSIKLGKLPGTEAVTDTKLRFRASSSADVITLLCTGTDGKIYFLGLDEANLIEGFTLSETLSTFDMAFDFVTGEATLSIDGTLVKTCTIPMPKGTTAKNLVDWIQTTKNYKYIFSWSFFSDKAEKHHGLVFDDISVKAVVDDAAN